MWLVVETRLVSAREARFRRGDFVIWDPVAGPEIGFPPGHPGVVQDLTGPPAVGVWWVLGEEGFRSFDEVYDQDWLIPTTADDFAARYDAVRRGERPSVRARSDVGFTDRGALTID
jgi:hypothetical protein